MSCTGRIHENQCVWICYALCLKFGHRSVNFSTSYSTRRDLFWRTWILKKLCRSESHSFFNYAFTHFRVLRFLMSCTWGINRNRMKTRARILMSCTWGINRNQCVWISYALGLKFGTQTPPSPRLKNVNFSTWTSTWEDLFWRTSILKKFCMSELLLFLLWWIYTFPRPSCWVKIIGQTTALQLRL